jgi:hypothetical protein
MGSRVKSALLLLSFLVLLLLQAGCLGFSTSAPGGGKEGGLSALPTTTRGGDGSIQDITSRNAPKVSLADTLAALPEGAREADIGIGGLTLTKVWGYGVDSSGLARTWVLGMQGNGRTSLISYSDGQFTELDIPTTLPTEEVRMGEIVSPQDLFKQNLNRIVQEMTRLRVGEADIALDGETYQVTLHSTTESSTLSFNARNGGLISSP